MDPPPPPQPPFSDQATAAVVPPAAANPAPAAPPANHPPYDEMIIGAVAALNEENGSSKQAIARYIESQYTDLPPTHADLLSHHLKALKISGQLVMVKHSYKLPTRSAPPATVPPTNGAVNNEVNTVGNAVIPSDPVAKRRPGRPPKRKLEDNVQAQPPVPVFPPPANDVNAVAPQDAAKPIGTDNAPVAAESSGAVNGPKRGRGRPPRAGGGPGRGPPGRPPKSGGVGRGRPRGRPPKQVNLVGAAPVTVPGVVPVASGTKRRGRPPKNAAAAAVAGGGAGNLGARKKQRRLSGKPLGRPKKNALATVSGATPDSQLLVAYLDLKAKFENLQARIRQTATLIRPCLNNEAALSTLQELEMAGMMNPYALPPPQAPQAQPPQAQAQFVQTQQAQQVPPQS